MHRAAAYLRLVRPTNLLITAAGVLLGGALSMDQSLLEAGLVPDLFTAAVSAVLIAAGGNCLNDVLDYRTDAVNRPNRPLPSGAVSPAVAWGIWLASTIAGVALAVFISSVHLLMALLASGVLYAYSTRLKQLPFVGNLAVGFVVALAVVYGGWAVGSPVPAYTAAGFALLTTIARELIKDVEDAEGDRVAGARTAPIVFGLPAVRRTAASVLILTVLLTPFPFLLMEYGRLFLFLVLIADLMLLRVVWLLPRTPPEAREASAWLKAAMVMGIVALFAA